MESRKELIEYISNNLDHTHYSIAMLLKKLYENKYCVTTENNKDTWFRFNGTYWEKSNIIIHELKNKISTEVAEIIIEARRSIREKQNSANTDQSFIENRMKTMLKIERSLYNAPFKNNLIKECESVLYKEELPKNI